jgi:hypothetical protein
MVDGIVGIDLLIWGFTVVVEVAFRHSASIDFALRVGPIHVEGGIVKLYVDPLP